MIVPVVTDLRDQHDRKLHRHATAHKFLAIAAVIGLILQTSLLLLSLFEPPLPYRILNPVVNR